MMTFRAATDKISATMIGTIEIKLGSDIIVQASFNGHAAYLPYPAAASEYFRPEGGEISEKGEEDAEEQAGRFRLGGNLI